MKFFAVTLCLTFSVVAQATKEFESRIVSGQDAKPAQFPWQVAIKIDLGSGYETFCGGSLISQGWVLTAAHCVDEGISWDIKIGGIVRTGSEPGSIIVSSLDGQTHESYDSWTLENDIALIKLNKDVPLSDTIQPIRLPSRSEVGNPLENLKLTVSGWGAPRDYENITKILQFVELDTITNQKCKEVHGTFIVDSTLCCIGHPEHSTCNGDSGGPLVRYDSDGQATQVGVASFTHRAGCASGNPSGYVRTAYYLDWINEKTGIPISD